MKPDKFASMVIREVIESDCGFISHHQFNFHKKPEYYKSMDSKDWRKKVIKILNNFPITKMKCYFSGPDGLDDGWVFWRVPYEPEHILDKVG